MRLFSLVITIGLAISGLAFAEHDHHDHNSHSRVVLDPGASATVFAGDDIQVVCRAGDGGGPGGAATRQGVELFASANCSGSASWSVREVAACAAPSRPDFYCTSYRSVYTNGTRGPCVSGPRVEEDNCCRAAFNGF